MLRMVLFTVLFAAPAAAQSLGPSVSGDVQMGLAWQSGPDWAGQRESGLRMTSRARLKFQFTGETDGGVRYGVELKLDEAGDRPPSRNLWHPAGPRNDVAQ